MTVGRMASILWVPALFLAASTGLYLISVNSPTLHDPCPRNDTDLGTTSQGRELRFPRSVDDLGNLAAVLRQYRADHIHYLVLLFCCAYLYKQTFAIPGSVFMNLLAGATFGFWYGLPLVCLLTATGATFCYLLSQGFGKYYVLKYLPTKVTFMQLKVAENRDCLFFFLLFVRLIPMSPNWLLNIVAPILNIPIHLFFASVLLGLFPYNFICVETGAMLSEISNVTDMFTVATLLKLSLVAFMALVPALLAKRLQTSSKSDLKTQ